MRRSGFREADALGIGWLGGARRIAIYGCGIVCVSLGIVLCKQCGMGISPISCVPLVLASIVPISFGMLTTLFHLVNTVAQMVLSRRLCDPRLWAQIPLALSFGVLIDYIGTLVSVDATNPVAQVLALAGSILFTALGMVLMVDMDLVQNPPDGTVKSASEISGVPFASMKVAYDVACVVVACILGLLFLGRLSGIGIATVVSALLVGRTVGWIRTFQTWTRKHLVRSA